MNKTLIAVLGVVAVVAVFAISKYNGMVSSEENVNSAWANVQTQYQRRADLIPNLVATVKGAANFEKGTLEAVIAARAKATQITIDPSKATPEQIKAYMDAQGELSNALGKLLAVSEAYPDLKATDNFKDLQTQLEGIENRIAEARKKYNEAVQTYNVSVRSFPGNIFASMFGFQTKTMFEADASAQSAPKVSFD